MKKISILNIIYTVFMEKNKKILKFYNKNGFYIFKNFYNKSLVEKIKKEIFYISSKLYKEKTNQKIIKYNSKKFDYYVLKSKKERLNDVNSAIYNTCKKLPSFFKIISHNQTYNICKFLMGSKNIGILNPNWLSNDRTLNLFGIETIPEVEEDVSLKDVSILSIEMAIFVDLLTL